MVHELIVKGSNSHFHQITLFQDVISFTRDRREVTYTVVYRHTCRERNAFFRVLLFFENLGGLIQDRFVSELANLSRRRVGNTFCKYLF